MKFSTTEDIAAPAEAVFDAFCDFASFERAAMRRGAEVQRLDHMAVPGVGMAWRAAFDMRGKRRQVEVEMVTFDRPDEIALETSSPGMKGMSSFEILPMGPNRTRLRVELDVRPLNLSARLLVQSLKLAKNSLGKKFKTRVAEYAKGMEERYVRRA